MGNEEFHRMLGILIDTPKEELTGETDEKVVKRKASEKKITLEEKDVKDLARVLGEIREIKKEAKLKLASPRN